MEAETLPSVPASDPPHPRLFRLRDAVGLLAAYIGVQIVVVGLYVLVLFVRFGPAQGKAMISTADNLNRMAIIGGVACCLAVFLLLRRIARRQGIGWRALGFLRPDPKWLWITLAVFFALRAVSTGLTFMAGKDIAAQSLETMNGVVSSDPRWNAVAAVLFVAAVPLLEEIVFRVMLFRALASRLPAFTAAALSVAVFVALHVQYTLAGGAVALLTTTEVTLLGAVLMWLYVRSGSIWPSLALHAANNGFAFFVLLFAF